MSPRLVVESTLIGGLLTAIHPPLGDARGELERLFCANDLDEVLGERHIVQVNRTLTRQVGAVRGMHYQLPPSAEMKIVTCMRGRIFDVAVDLRAGSPTFLRPYGIELSEGTHRSFVIPEGFAHGFQVLESDSELLYFHTAFYDPVNERGLAPTDPALGIEWPLEISQISDRDAQHELVSDTFEGVRP